MANRGMPSMLALLGLLAVAGYQNRDKIGAALNNLGGGSAAGGTGQGGLGGMLGGSGGGLGQILSGLGAGGLTGGLGDLMNSFKNAGHAEVADSWVRPGVPTQGLTPEQVQQAIGDENLTQLAQQTGLSRDELLKRLATAIPETVDKLTPNGEMPTEEQARQNLGLPTV
ncbi:MAG: YidB family protein [Devosia sp.]